MNVDLLTTSEGEVMLAMDEPLAGEVERIEYVKSLRQMVIIYKDTNLPAFILEHPVDRQLAPVIEKAPQVGIAVMEGDEIADVKLAPLVVV